LAWLALSRIENLAVKKEITVSDTKNRSSISLNNFLFGELRPDHKVRAPTAPPPPLGPLSAFVGDFAGNGFNTIFRPRPIVDVTWEKSF
jgi:hypothetical protein